ncbi:MAG: hypothetical protein FD122_290 [Stygiobacter sp.]|nr:MAG: hypothetical protein FD122_290 [Stygiobacter sp.]KAF0214237.1 MAG: hypothetical protein FD178_2626 [Ignavibacteria bacterium]
MVAPVKLLKQKITDDESSCPSILLFRPMFSDIKKLNLNIVPKNLFQFTFYIILFQQHLVRRTESKRFYLR